MGRTPMVVRDPFVGTLGLDLAENRFELPDSTHVEPDGDQILPRIVGQLLLEGRHVRIDGNVREPDDFPAEHALGRDDDRLRHLSKTSWYHYLSSPESDRIQRARSFRRACGGSGRRVLRIPPADRR